MLFLKNRVLTNMWEISVEWIDDIKTNNNNHVMLWSTFKLQVLFSSYNFV